MNVSLLKYLMEQKGISKNDLATSIGVQYNAICSRLTGKVEFKLSELQTIKETLNLSDEQILDVFFKKTIFQKEEK